MPGKPPEDLAANPEADAPLAEHAQAELRDFVQLLRDALDRREVYLDPRRGLGSSALEDSAIQQLREDYAPQLLRLEREMLKLAKRAAGLRALMRPDPDPKHPLPPGFYAEHHRDFLRSRDVLWETAKAWAERCLDATHAKHANAAEHLTHAIYELVERGATTRPLPTDWKTLNELTQQVLQPSDQKRVRGSNYVVGKLSVLTGVSENTIREAIARAETPRAFAWRGTTLEERESAGIEIVGEDEALRYERARLAGAKERAFKRQSPIAMSSQADTAALQREIDEYAQIHAEVRARLPAESTEEEILAAVDDERFERRGRNG